MATLYVTEYSCIMDDRVQITSEPPLNEQTVAIGASSTASVAFTAQTRMIRLHCDAICSVLIGKTPAGAAPTATASSGRMAANQTEYRGVQPGMFVAVITNT